MEKLDYQRDISIDESQLDIECLEQASLMMKYGRNEADAEEEYELKKQELDLVRAELDLQIRENPAKFEISSDVKLTEAVVSGTLIKQRRYKTVFQEYLDAKHELKVATNAVRAFQGRKNMLEALVDLYIGNYFSCPSAPRNIVQERKKKMERQQEIDNGISSNLRKRRRNYDD